ncbi:brk family protein [Megaselia abdita]
MEFNNNNSVIKLQMNSNSQVPINSTKPAIAATTASTDTTPKAKMGSRRIFKTEFKVQVLDSYWNDNDCKGNQRATARKYGIHRRQIQKWLGNEKSLREQLKNQNTNNVVKPHQFHNVAYGAPAHKPSTSPQSASKLMSLGQARHSVAPTSTTSLSPSSSSSSSLSMSLSPSAVGTTTTTAITPIRPIPHQHTPVTIVPPTHYTQQHYHHYHHSQLPHFMPPSTSLPTTSTTDVEYSLMVAGNHHHHQQQQLNNHQQQQHHFNIHHHYHHQQQQQQQQQQLHVMAPIDLSLQRKPEILENQPPMKLSLKHINFNDEPQTPSKPSSSSTPVLAVDLTCRKRHSQCVTNDCTPEKVQKIKKEEEDDEEVDVEVDDGIELQVAKPVKLFKPYLLDEEEKHESEQQQDPIIWSHSLTPNNRQCSSRSTTDSGCYPFPSGSPIFPSSPSSLGAFSPAAACPKGSPVSVSGYESSSSTSTFGESSYPPTYHYSLDFKVNQYPSARNDNHSHVQRWLDHDANLRQGIAY